MHVPDCYGLCQGTSVCWLALTRGLPQGDDCAIPARFVGLWNVRQRRPISDAVLNIAVPGPPPGLVPRADLRPRPPLVAVPSPVPVPGPVPVPRPVPVPGPVPVPRPGPVATYLLFPRPRPGSEPAPLVVRGPSS